MKNKFKILSSILILFSLFLISCDQESRLKDSPNSGWVQFTSSSDIEVQNGATSVEIPIKLFSGSNINGLTVTYRVELISGTSTNAFGTFTTRIDANSKEGAITYNFTQSSDIQEIKFTLINVNDLEYTVGLSDFSKPISRSIFICAQFNNTNFLGDYILTVPTGAGPFGTVFADNQTVTVTEDFTSNLSRTFSVDYLPAINAGLPVVDIIFTFDGQLRILGSISTGVGCASEIILTNDNGNEPPLPCDDSSITLKLLDFSNATGSCGVSDVPVTVLLTKI